MRSKLPCPILSSNQNNENLHPKESVSLQIFDKKPSPPFRPCGRGAQQLSKAIILSKNSPSLDSNGDELNWVLCTGSHPCFAKVLTLPSNSHESVCIQPMKPNQYDPNIFVLWDGHTWLAKRKNLVPVKVTRRRENYTL